MYTMEDFKAGKIAVWAETEEEAKRFLGACEDVSDSLFVGPDAEYAYGFMWGFPGISCAAGPGDGPNREYHSRNREPDEPPFASVTVREFFGDPA